ncbi:Type IV secretory pathway, VirB4 components [Nocardia otitidiscaviarum]|uniref:Type IV secretory pathway, VirB4 components n=2 Tax=Nocardia otitidiscaviarum TaxID=1823 RepID=A0A378YU92_9NOCA|nr:hypothetical protein [Nocardia otitidiscaviarum]SUA80742.1 Type IV secretory pathway, VirB4 components [Nocardia otitidiscaviarum]
MIRRGQGEFASDSEHAADASQTGARGAVADVPGSGAQGAVAGASGSGVRQAVDGGSSPEAHEMVADVARSEARATVGDVAGSEVRAAVAVGGEGLGDEGSGRVGERRGHREVEAAVRDRRGSEQSGRERREQEAARREGRRGGTSGRERREAEVSGRERRRGEDGAPERRRDDDGARERRDGEARQRPRAEHPVRERVRGTDLPEGERMRKAEPGRERAGDAGGRRPVEGDRRGRENGRGRAVDGDRVHLGGRAATPGRPRRPRHETEPVERTGRGRRTGRNADKPDRAALAAERAEQRAKARKGKGGKPKQSGPKLLDDSTRARLEAVAREKNGLGAAWAAFRLHTDDLRRRNFAARVERMEYGSHDEFDRTTAQLTDRGYIGEGGGRMNVIGRPVEYRATTAQVAGLWPWSVGAGAPLIGTPLGSHLHTGAPVCFDPMNWFMRGSFITAPSLFVLGLNGFGKSSLVRRIVLGGVAQGITPLILADVKPDYRKLVELVGGQVIDLGYGHGKLNPLAAGVLGSIVPRLSELPALQTQVVQEMRARQVTLIAGLVELVRGARVRDYEETLISTGLRILYREGSGFTPDQPPILENLLEVIVAGGDELKLDAGADDDTEYQNAIKGLRRSLRALTQGPFGAVFNGHTTTPIDTAATAVCIDVSHIPNGDKKLKAAVMLACWADGFASVEAAHVLADADMGPQRYFQVVMDELWQVLGLGDFMVDRVDELTRLQRSIATALIMISHTIKDLQALGSEAAIAKALGFLERARAKIFGALPAEEIARLDSTVPFTAAEEEMVTSWSAPQALTGEALKPGQHRPSAPGTGKFLLKIGEDRRPGIPFHMEFTPSERESGIHDTNQRFSEFTESTSHRGSDEEGAA